MNTLVLVRVLDTEARDLETETVITTTWKTEGDWETVAYIIYRRI
jgi:hypothetical protein